MSTKILDIKSQYTIYIHRDTELPLNGLGYREERRQEAQARVDKWNTYTVETCSHKDILEGQVCRLCGHRWMLSNV